MGDQVFHITRIAFNEDKLIVPYCLVNNIVIRNNVCCIYIRPRIETLFVEVR